MRRSVGSETVIESVDLGGEVSVEIFFGCVARSFGDVGRKGSVDGWVGRGGDDTSDADAGLLLLTVVESVGGSGSSCDGGGGSEVGGGTCWGEDTYEEGRQRGRKRKREEERERLISVDFERRERGKKARKTHQLPFLE